MLLDTGNFSQFDLDFSPIVGCVSLWSNRRLCRVARPCYFPGSRTLWDGERASSSKPLLTILCSPLGAARITEEDTLDDELIASFLGIEAEPTVDGEPSLLTKVISYAYARPPERLVPPGRLGRTVENAAVEPARNTVRKGEPDCQQRCSIHLVANRSSQGRSGLSCACPNTHCDIWHPSHVFWRLSRRSHTRSLSPSLR